MASLTAPSLPVSQAGRALHDLGLAGMLGGNLFGRHALHPSVTAISDPAERGKVVNAAWRRYGTINALSLGAVAVGHYTGRLDETSARRLSRPERGLMRAKDALVGAVAFAGVTTAVEGVRFSRMEPESAVSLRDGAHADAALTQRNFRRPVLRRLVMLRG